MKEIGRAPGAHAPLESPRLIAKPPSGDCRACEIAAHVFFLPL